MIAIPNMEKPKRCELCPCSYYSEGALSDICQVTDKPIDGKPTDCPLIDIVRCGECKWCDDKGKGRALICTNPYIDMDIHPLDFCSYGERRADEID